MEKLTPQDLTNLPISKHPKMCRFRLISAPHAKSAAHAASQHAEMSCLRLSLNFPRQKTGAKEPVNDSPQQSRPQNDGNFPRENSDHITDAKMDPKSMSIGTNVVKLVSVSHKGDGVFVGRFSEALPASMWAAGDAYVLEGVRVQGVLTRRSRSDDARFNRKVCVYVCVHVCSFGCIFLWLLCMLYILMFL
jgi:hypothetical protein